MSTYISHHSHKVRGAAVMTDPHPNVVLHFDGGLSVFGPSTAGHEAVSQWLTELIRTAQHALDQWDAEETK